ncbi:MAG TPA: hypothetical protein VD794_09605, partial [Flavisolibacter sp.]|nr:hypothetical protein [Flavisolibacter sp.]
IWHCFFRIPFQSIRNNMTPDKNQQGSSHSGQEQNEQVSHQTGTQYRPDWIIPDNGISSRDNNTSNNRQESQPDNSSIPLDNDETLGIP